MANSRFAIRMFLQFSIDISVVSLINELIRFFHFASNFLNAICFSKRTVSIACFSLFVIIMVSGIVTQFQCKWISRAVSHHMYRCLHVLLHWSLSNFRYRFSSISSGVICFSWLDMKKISFLSQIKKSRFFSWNVIL